MGKLEDLSKLAWQLTAEGVRFMDVRMKVVGDELRGQDIVKTEARSIFL